MSRFKVKLRRALLMASKASDCQAREEFWLDLLRDSQQDARCTHA